MELNLVEIRVLGCLIEKEKTTPEYYPLTLNALVNACSQKSNRNPVMAFDAKMTVRAIDDLREKYHLAIQVTSSESRVPKYKHSLSNVADFSDAEIAILCELFLRGPQTSGDLRARASRIYSFADRNEVEEVLQHLSLREDGPFVVQLPREPGKREQRWAHLFSGEPEVELTPLEPLIEPARLVVQAENERIEALEAEIKTLRQEFETLKASFDEFVTAFE